MKWLRYSAVGGTVALAACGGATTDGLGEVAAGGSGSSAGASGSGGSSSGGSGGAGAAGAEIGGAGGGTGGSGGHGAGGVAGHSGAASGGSSGQPTGGAAGESTGGVGGQPAGGTAGQATAGTAGQATGGEPGDWIVQFGSSERDRMFTLREDPQGNVIAEGTTEGSIEGGLVHGSQDIVLQKRSPSGELLWSRQTGSSGWDYGAGLEIGDDGRIYFPYVFGEESHLEVLAPNGDPLIELALDFTVVRSFSRDSTGRLLFGGKGPAGEYVDVFTSDLGFGWRHVMPEGAPVLRALADADGNVYLFGHIRDAALPGYTPTGNNEHWARKLDPQGNEIWSKQFGEATYGRAIQDAAVDPQGNAYVLAYTVSAPPELQSAYLYSLAPDGSLRWTRELSNTTEFFPLQIGFRAGHLLVTSVVQMSVEGGTYAGLDDCLVQSRGLDGELEWSRELGTPLYEYCWATLGATHLLVGGLTTGAFDGYTQQKRGDAFIGRLAL